MDLSGFMWIKIIFSVHKILYF